MKKLQDMDSQQLAWVEPKRGPNWYELHADDEVVATLRWEKTFRRPAIAESAEGCWTFERSGLIRPRVSVRVTGSESELATLSLSGSRLLEFSNGRRFEWVPQSRKQPKWMWRDSGSEPVLHMQGNQVVVEAMSRGVPELSLLVLMAQYLRVPQMSFVFTSGC
jgi:hypothetical protein